MATAKSTNKTAGEPGLHRPPWLIGRANLNPPQPLPAEEMVWSEIACKAYCCIMPGFEQGAGP